MSTTHIPTAEHSEDSSSHQVQQTPCEEPGESVTATASQHGETPADEESEQSGDLSSIHSSAALISVCVIISRITGFIRTWAIAFAVGSTLVASSYQVANSLPNQLYELVAGGMLVTAFLPVFVSTRKKLGTEGANEYASTLFSLTLVVLGVTSLVCSFFAPQLIYTQSFMSDQETMSNAVFFFRFFAFQIVFYGISTILSGLLNGSRDYLWSNAAPIFNNLVVTAAFIAYALVAPSNPQLGLLILAIGNPLGVALQALVQVPALRRNGIHLRFHIDLHNKALRETVTIGVPALLVTLAGLIIVSVQNSAAIAVDESGPSIIYYARLWFTLPYAFLTTPITTAMFTEIAEMYSRGDMKGFRNGLISGINQITFYMVPFMMYLIVFAFPLVTLYHIGAFSEQDILDTSLYLMALAVSLPLYSVNTYLQKAFSALRKMRQFAYMMVVAAAVQIAFTIVFSTGWGGAPDIGLFAIAFGESVYYLLLDAFCLIYLKRTSKELHYKSIWIELLKSAALGLAGTIPAYLLMNLMTSTIVPMDGSIINALVVIIVCGLVAVGITFGIAIKAKMPEAEFLVGAIGKIKARLHR
jgi:putative peptidoglycan lipid II flippase